ncbi:EAL domain-containing protein [Roseobacter cerasinus]|nr:EAL domain-containing protein [Roseobacter cerasinus]
MRATLTRRGIANPRVSLNLSSAQLGNETVVEWLLDERFMRNVSATQVNIEVLESTLLDERVDRIGQNIMALSNAGFRIELDDFGTGHTALASLTRFPVHQIKVDRSLVNGVDQDSRKRAIAGGLYLVCRKLGIEAIAEGVETAAELNALQEFGFTNFQGYHFARPSPNSGCWTGWMPATGTRAENGIGHADNPALPPTTSALPLGLGWLLSPNRRRSLKPADPGAPTDPWRHMRCIQKSGHPAAIDALSYAKKIV